MRRRPFKNWENKELTKSYGIHDMTLYEHCDVKEDRARQGKAPARGDISNEERHPFGVYPTALLRKV